MVSSFNSTLGQTLANPALIFHAVHLAFLAAIKGKFTKNLHLFFVSQSNQFYFHGDFGSPFNPNYAVSPQRVWVIKFNLELE